MTEIDLIPGNYRTLQWQKSWLRNATVSVVVLMLLLVTAFVALHKVTAAVEVDIANLQAKQQFSAQQRLEFETLTAEKAKLENQLSLLNGLRKGGNAADTLLSIERALGKEDLWIVDWRFKRAGVVVEEAREGVNTGYFIVVPRDSEATDERPWQVRTHMSIRGQSRDHSGLSTFVRNLFAQTSVEDVQVGRTSVGRLAATDVVDFDLAVVMDSDVRSE